MHIQIQLRYNQFKYKITLNTTKYYSFRFYFPYLSLLAQPVDILVYYTLRFCFPYLSLLAQSVTILLYGPVVYGPARYLHYFR
jgi:hypothetical protein